MLPGPNFQQISVINEIRNCITIYNIVQPVCKILKLLILRNPLLNTRLLSRKAARTLKGRARRRDTSRWAGLSLVYGDMHANRTCPHTHSTRTGRCEAEKDDFTPSDGVTCGIFGAIRVRFYEPNMYVIPIHTACVSF